MKEFKFFWDESCQPLNTDILLQILHYLNLREINMLAGFRGWQSTEILFEFYWCEMIQIEHTFCKSKLGAQLITCAWHDIFWKEPITKKIKFINEQVLSIYFQHEDLLEIPQKNFRRDFISQIWQHIVPSVFENITRQRIERAKYLESIPDYLLQIMNDKSQKKSKQQKSSTNDHSLNEKVIDHDKNHVGAGLKHTPSIASLMYHKSQQGMFIENTEQEIARFSCHNHNNSEMGVHGPLRLSTGGVSNSKTLKWYMVGKSQVGKTCLMCQLTNTNFDWNDVPETLNNYSTTCFIPRTDMITQHSVEDYDIEYFDISSKESHFESLSNATVCTLAFAVDDWSSMTYLFDHLLWEIYQFLPQHATIQVLGLKKENREIQRWKSLFALSSNDVSSSPCNNMETEFAEPVSYEEALKFSQYIGASAYDEVSARKCIGLQHWNHRLACLRHFDQFHWKKISQVKKNKLCSKQ
ncbi:hypothetical protein C9374_010924 [Naegleria lovaniensis]|uniref:Uncharacterized protein n=1 Tax=Naegleria lovaniensis TaxID=51637 RepID=A0AA88GGV7_NAELO|nr:uncharacterized protein C9374_010924 [Naegleria lovaniensis]KAG2374354.1 hypothetical protein C9374_010924 [Naegleria lovaniensis]